MSTAVAFEDTPAWEAGLRVHEAENKWLLREFLAVLGASKSYARSLSGGGVDLGMGDGLGGVLGALAGAGAGALAAGMEGIGLGDGAGADGSDGAVRVGVSAEANFAAARGGQKSAVLVASRTLYSRRGKELNMISTYPASCVL